MPGTRCIDYAELKRQVETVGRAGAVAMLEQALEQKHLQPTDFSVRELAEAFMGREWVDNLHPKRGRFVGLLEADGSAVSYSHFSNITGQIFFTMVKQAYEDEELVFSKIIPTKQSDIQDTEKVPGISEIGDEAEIVQESEPYPLMGVSEDYIEVGAKQKRGFIVPVTKEAIFGDRTGMLLERCKKGGKWMGVNKEKRLIDCAIDENGGAKSIALGGHRYHWKGTSYASYQATTPWINIKTSNGLSDWTSINAAWLLLAQMVDPYTGEPIMFQPKDLIVTPQNLWLASRIISATEVRSTAPGFATSGTPQQTSSGNPVQLVLKNLQVVSSRLLAARAATDTDWWLGNLSESFAYVENWGIITEDAPSNSSEAFHRDITMMFKASEKGVAATIEPRGMVENQA